jgi:pimeloyl-ACP methyl ester carboxylesterase
MVQQAIVFIHGFPLEGSYWQRQVDAFQGKATVLAPDLRGFGNDRRNVPAVVRMEDHASDLKAMLDEQGMERVVLCGLSMGGYVALAFLARWPERVAGLALCNTRATADDATGRAAREAMARDAVAKGMAPIARAMLPKLLAEGTRRYRPELVEEIRAMIARQQPGAVAASALGMALRADRMAMLPDIRIPTTVITGEADELMPMPTSQAMADAIPGCRLTMLPGAGHLSNVEAPEAFNKALQLLLDRVAHHRP